MQRGCGVACGKIILMGEHAVVYGKPAIALPFSQVNVHCRVEPNISQEIESAVYSGALDQAPSALDGVRALITGIWGEAGLKLSLESSLPTHSGLGSSAAVSVAVVKALYQAQEKALTTAELHDWVHLAEGIHHTNPSGLDGMTIALERPIYFTDYKEPFEVSMDAYLVVADTGVKGHTKEAVLAIKEILQTNPKAHDWLDQLEEATVLAHEALLKNDALGLGLCMTKAQRILSELSVSHPVLDQLIELSRPYALGAKLTGGGRGGCMIALCQSKTQATELSQVLLDNNAKQTWILDLKEVNHG